jgi:hypothetical protein
MFIFQRSGHSTTHADVAEVWRVLLPEGSLPDAAKRFGPALVHDGTELSSGPTECHEVGVLFLYHRDEDQIDFLLGAKGALKENEERMLSFAIENLVGASIHDGEEPVNGWYWFDTLKKAG